ncbi:Hypp7666 [Branchiostoma lanceolatum]|uniref:Hypp7666 protein n=1 Tax=Branchiostoma lanceolatum TaxID=7740 RepID=A0A8K0EBL2_BRALA|nr:Hypp7666 [Branchiostoma lanceolatum]
MSARKTRGASAKRHDSPGDTREEENGDGKGHRTSSRRSWMGRESFSLSRLEKLEKKNEVLETKLADFERDSDERIKRITQKLKATEGLVEELELKSNKLERFEDGTTCIRIIGRKIERAHPDGPKSKSDGDGTPQHILFKLNSYQDKISIMKVARVKLKSEGYHFTDDLTMSDMQEKRKWRDNVREAYGKGVKYRFFNGLWRDSKGKPWVKLMS